MTFYQQINSRIMEGSSAAVPYHDHFDNIDTANHMPMFDESLSLEFPDLSEFGHSTSPSHSIPQPGNNATDKGKRPMEESFAWGSYNGVAGPSEIGGQTNGCDQGNCNPFNSIFGNSARLSIWPVEPVQYSCTCCQPLREFLHTDGIHVTKLEIHGRIGIICHGILENYAIDVSDQTREILMFDFCKESVSNVKQFLQKYCEERNKAGFFMMQDPLSQFYEALCVGLHLNCHQNLSKDDDLLQPSSGDTGGLRMNGHENMVKPVMEAQFQAEIEEPLSEAEADPRTAARTSLAIQRARTGRLTLSDLTAFFRYPIEMAAKKMSVCPTVIKKICRKHGILRWPYRKIRSIERKIQNKMAVLQAGNPEEKALVQAEIQKLQEDLADIYREFNGE